MQLSKNELAKKLGFTTRKLDYLLKRGDLKEWKKIKTGKAVFFQPVDTSVVEAEEGYAEKLRLRKLELTEAQVLKIRQQLDEGRKEIQKEYRSTILDQLMIFLRELKDGLNGLGLNEEQCRKYLLLMEKTIDKLPDLKAL